MSESLRSSFSTPIKGRSRACWNAKFDSHDSTSIPLGHLSAFDHGCLPHGVPSVRSRSAFARGLVKSLRTYSSSSKNSWRSTGSVLEFSGSHIHQPRIIILVQGHHSYVMEPNLVFLMQRGVLLLLHLSSSSPVWLCNSRCRLCCVVPRRNELRRVRRCSAGRAAPSACRRDQIGILSTAKVAARSGGREGLSNQLPREAVAVGARSMRLSVKDRGHDSPSWDSRCRPSTIKFGIVSERRQFGVNLSSRCAMGDSGAQNHAPTANPLASKCVRRNCYESCSRSRCQQFVADQRRSATSTRT